MRVRAKVDVTIPGSGDILNVGDAPRSVPAALALYMCLQGLVTLEGYEDEIMNLVQASGDPVQQGGDRDAAKIVSPTQVSGTVARYHVAAQSTTRSRIELPSGAKAIRIGYFARQTDGAKTADGELLKVVFNIASTTEAATALAESASSAGTLSGVSYLAIPIDTVYEAAFPDPDDRLYYVDFLTLTAEAGESDVIVEVTL